MKLQLSLDLVTLVEAIALIEATRESVDIIEIGTPLIIKEGIAMVRTIHDLYPDKQILADIKIMDGGKHEARYAFEAGASLVTVLAVAEDATIRNTIEVAHSMGRQVMVDMIAVRDIPTRAAEVAAFGADYLCVHTAVDVQDTGRNSLAELLSLATVVPHFKTAVAGGIKLNTAETAVAARPEILVVGSAITSAVDPEATAAAFRRIMDQA